ncbi:hypothetical protein ABY42_18695 (plasmid) [Haloferax gibbonsii]|uniref:Uncharacterized protein n=1 Tax=Haloferax gibbonsii TaxID=35746 RepID=A0A0K1IZX1_HALGI|nr:hypothetical protein ABY42_18695 [Haloferax gibbonsii]
MRLSESVCSESDGDDPVRMFPMNFSCPERANYSLARPSDASNLLWSIWHLESNFELLISQDF